MALACTDPPAGRARWTLQLLAAQAVVLELTPAISAMSVHRMLQTTRCSPIASAAGASRPRECRLRSPHGGRAGGVHPAL